MSWNAQISSDFWIDDYSSNLDPIEKLVFLYFLTSPHGNISGVYQVPIKLVAVETGIDKDMLIKIIERLSKDEKIIYKDGWVAIKNRIKFNKMDNSSIQQGISTKISKAPSFIGDFLEIDTLSTGSVKPDIDIDIDIDKNCFTDFDKVLESWNNSTWRKKIKNISKDRQLKFKARQKNKLFVWSDILTACDNAGDFLKTGSWFGFDWLIKNDNNFTKLLEGNYQDRTKKTLIIDSQADTRFFLVTKDQKYKVMNNDTDTISYKKESWEQIIKDFETENKVKAVIKYE